MAFVCEEAADCQTAEELDTDAIASPVRTQRKRQRRSVKDQCCKYPPGPRDLNEVLSHNVDLMHRLFDDWQMRGHDTRSRLLQVAELDVVVTSCYSGTGCFEGVLRQLESHLHCKAEQSGLTAGKITSYAATELHPSGQTCLLSHNANIAHVFEDVLGRLPEDILQKLKEIEGSALSDFKNLQAELALGQIDKVFFGQQKSRMEEAYLHTLKSELQQVEFRATDHCKVHGQQCFVSPRHDPRYRSSYWIEMSGNTCCPWSGMSTHNGWLDVATLPFLVWGFSTRFYEPDSVFQENVPRFPESELMSIIGDMSEGVLKDIHTRPLVASEEVEPRRYKMHAQVFSPVDLGIPSQRMRQYTALHLSPWVQFDLGVSFEDVCFRALETDASIFLNAFPKHVRCQELQLMFKLRAKGCSTDALDDQMVCDRSALNNGDHGRLESWHCWSRAPKNGLQDGSGKWTSSFALVDLTQNARFSNRANAGSMPCLLTGTLLWDLVNEQLVPAAVHWLAQGFAHPAAEGVSEDNRAAWPFSKSLLDPSSDAALSYKHQRMLTGNAMHWSSVGAWLLFNFSCTDKSRLMCNRAGGD